MADPMMPPRHVRGTPTRLQLMEVVTVNTGGTVDLRLASGRATKSHVPYPSRMTLTLGDLVIVGDLDGDPQLPRVIAVSTQAVSVIDGGAP